ncbi:YwmB family TATA-box binding protein [Clostridium sp. Marseille-Q2269]|uniref:YwmB family TATA-box binding protein n=1 Tax=Clostridium sp. Marseille-Q2269 TaxID=2942205 RepID=UPI002073B9BB|nr:YwmB family TATA-box binding protein [Clostridium sp. Marseille-Q2269]
MSKNIKLSVIFILLFPIVSAMFGPKNYFKAEAKDELFFEITEKTNSQIVELGGNVSFSTQLTHKEFIKEICSYLELNKNFNKKLFKEKHSYNIYFYNKEMSGNINIKEYNNENIVMMDFKSNTLNKSFINLKNKIKSYLELNNKKDYIFQYLKAENNNKNLEKLNSDINSILNRKGSKNIETVKLDNGYSTTAYTKRYTPINVCGKKIDFNYAVCKYNSEKSYLILGTPQINLTY